MGGFHAAQVLADSIHTGLAVLVRLARARASRQKEVRSAVEATQRLWKKAQTRANDIQSFTQHDIWPIQSAENNLRSMYLQILWWSTRKYGNTEFKRVRNWEEGTVGPINGLLNFAGARLRDLAVTRYPFPDPLLYQIRVYADDSRKVLTESMANAVPDDDSIKSYWRAGYPGNSKCPRIILRHSSLPSLEFVDMIRAHIIELVRQCFIHSVPRNESHRYIRLLIHRLRPFLDYVYTGGETGRSDYYTEGHKILRGIVLDIRTIYGRRIGRGMRTTELLDAESISLSIGDIRSKAIDLRNITTDKEERKKLGQLLDMIDNGIVVERDAEKLREQINRIIVGEGNTWHRILLSGFNRPTSFKEIVFAGDKFLDTKSPILVASEVPIAGGSSDIVIFVRREVAKGIVFTPIMVIELKTKTSIDFALFSTKSRSGNDYLPEFFACKRPFTAHEWNMLENSLPRGNTMDQLVLYEQNIVQEYKNLVPSDPKAPEKLWKGVLILDSQEDHKKVFDAAQILVSQLCDELATLNHDVYHWKRVGLKKPKNATSNSPRIAMLVHSNEGPHHLIAECIPPDQLPEYNPFEKRISDERLLTVYVPVDSPTSSGKAAAWISKNWHLLHHLQECLEHSQHIHRVVWLDLLGDFSTKHLRKKRMGIEAMYHRGELSQKKRNASIATLDSIEFFPLETEINKIVSGRVDEGLRNFIGKIQASFHDESGIIFVIDGWTEFRRMMPKKPEDVPIALEKLILSVLPNQNIEIIWIDSPRNHNRMNPYYQRSCAKALHHNSPRLEQVDEIIWNLPTSPRIFGWRSPRHSDIRVIVQEIASPIPPWRTAIHVPCLKAWGRKFRGLKDWGGALSTSELAELQTKSQTMHGRLVTLSNMIPPTISDCEKLEESAMTLLPSLDRGFQQESNKDHSSKLPEYLNEISSLSNPGSPVPLTTRLTLVQNELMPITLHSQKDIYSLDLVSRPWAYDTMPSYQRRPENVTGTTIRPPPTGVTAPSTIDSTIIRRKELGRLEKAAGFLRKSVSTGDDLYVDLHKIMKTCNRVLSGNSTSDVLLQALQKIRAEILKRDDRAKTWRLIDEQKEEVLQNLNPINKKNLRDAIAKNPQLLQLYGMNLFLAVYVAARNNFDHPFDPRTAKLWNSISYWIPIQMGFEAVRRERNRVQSVYNFRALYSNLEWRARQLQSQPSNVLVQRMDYQVGAILSIEPSYPLDLWVFLPSEEDFSLKAALLTDQESMHLRTGFHPCVIDPSELASKAEKALMNHESTPIILTRVLGESILWMQDAEDNEWQILGMLQYGFPSKGMFVPIRWIRITWPPQEVMLSIRRPENVQLPDNPDERVVDLLREISSFEVESEHVDCYITIDDEREVYRVMHRAGNQSYIGIETEYTQEVIEYIRAPFRTGKFPSSADGVRMVWSHVTDVVYPDLEIKSEDKIPIINMSFLKPFVQRSSFYPEILSLPETCEELLDMQEGPRCTLMIQEEKFLAERRRFKRFRIEFRELEENSPFKQFERKFMHIYDVVLLADCKQLVDSRRGLCHPVDIGLGDIDLSKIPDVSEYKRFNAAIQGRILTKELDDEYEYDPELDESKDGWGTDENLVFLCSHIKVGRRGLVRIIVRLALQAEQDNYDDFVIVEDLSRHIREGDVVSNSIWEEIDHRIGHLTISNWDLECISDEVGKIIEDRGLSLYEEEYC